MNKFFVGLALLLGFFSSTASAQSVDCTSAVYANTETCLMHMRQGKPPIAYQDRMLCTLIHLTKGTRRKVTFVVEDATGNVLNKDNPQHTSYKVDGEYMCVGWHWWEMVQQGGRVGFCVDYEPSYNNRRAYWFSTAHKERDGHVVNKVAERLAFGTQYAPQGRFIAGLRVQ